MPRRRDAGSNPTDSSTEGWEQDPWLDLFDDDLEPTWNVWRPDPPPDDGRDPVAIRPRPRAEVARVVRRSGRATLPAPPRVEIGSTGLPPVRFVEPSLDPDPDIGMYEAETVVVDHPGHPRRSPPTRSPPTRSPPTRSPPTREPTGRLRVATIRPDEPDRLVGGRYSSHPPVRWPSRPAAPPDTRTLQRLVVAVTVAFVVLWVALVAAIVYALSW